jgi:putative membrane protein
MSVQTTLVEPGKASISGVSARAADRVPLALLAVFLVWWALLAIAPSYRQDWLLENVLVFIVLPLLIWGYRHLRLSNTSYSLIFVFLCLHELGAHYTYSEVPVSAWVKQLTGIELAAATGIERNHYDRFIHFSYGLLMLLPCVEIFQARARLVGMWQALVPVTFLMSHSELYEIIEWQAAEIFGGELGQAYLGTQGDIWDAQKDSSAAAIGAISGMVIYQAIQKFRKKHNRVGDTTAPVSPAPMIPTIPPT